MLNMKEHTQISKFLSLILRHKPEEIGLKLDQEGWAKIEFYQAENGGWLTTHVPVKYLSHIE